MRTLHASKELRTKFTEAARIITTDQEPNLQIPHNVPYIVSEAGLREVLTRRLKSDFIADETVKYTGEPVEQSTHARYVVQPGKYIDEDMREELSSLLSCPTNRIKRQTSYWYPPGSYLQWSVKPNFPGWRVYFVYADRPNESFLRYMENGAIQTNFNTGFDLKMFYAGDEKEFWHTIYAGRSNVLISSYNVLA